MENNDKSKWINTILNELHLANRDASVNIVEACGRKCIKSSDDYQRVLKLRKKIVDIKDENLIFEICKRDLYNNRASINKFENKIIIEYKECSCGMVTSGKVNNPFLCNCTVGYTKQIFETIFNRPVTVELQKSILNGDEICKQVVTI